MTTDITELAQREKFEAWWEREYKHLESSKYTDAVPHIKYGFWMAYQAGGAELVEALEKAKTEIEKWHRMANRLGEQLEESDRLESRTVTVAAADVLAERQRQITAEGWTPEHDDKYQHCEMAVAAACYIMADDDPRADVPELWPWPSEWWKPTDVRRDLVKAGALILAEIERLDRAAGIKWEAE
ncbi:TPA: hypothetical protein ACKE6T_004383 [Klebsiella oxytoca]